MTYDEAVEFVESTKKYGSILGLESTLRALIDRALEYNKDMLIAASRVKEMAAQNR